MKNLKMIRKFEGELYTFDANDTVYKIVVTDLGSKGMKLEGGRFMVTLLSPINKAYCFNWDDGDYIASSYVREKFPELGEKDAESISEFLNEYFKAFSANVFIDRI